MPGDGRIPLRIAGGIVTPRDHEAVVLAGNSAIAAAGTLIRHAGPAAAAQAGACACCRVPSDLVTVLRRLVIDRARGEAEFRSVVVCADVQHSARILAELAGDPLVAARYALPGA